MGFSRQECWSGLPFPSPDLLLISGDLPDPGIEPRSPALQADAFPSEPPGKPPQYVPMLSFPSTFCFRVQSESHVAFGGLAFGGLVSLIVFNLGVSSAFPCRRTLTFRSLGHFLECSTAWCVCFLVMRFRLKHVGKDTGEWGCVLLIRAPQEACDHGLFP